MNHWERVLATLQGEVTDSVPVRLWQHFPQENETERGLAEATLRWQNAYDFDLVKFSPTGTYGIEDWGAQKNIFTMTTARARLFNMV